MSSSTLVASEDDVLGEIVIRFLVGGIVVSLFATLSDVLRPKSFAGLFDAAPSVALATLTLTVAKDGPEYASTEARAMIAGAIGLLVYAQVTSWMLMKRRPSSLAAASAALPVWFAVSFALCALCALWWNVLSSSS